jgi:hypothetical protein
MLPEMAELTRAQLDVASAFFHLAGRKVSSYLVAQRSERLELPTV